VATGRTLKPIERIRREVDDLSSKTLDRRVPEPGSDDEVARLARTMNTMLSRLETATTRQQEFVSDASHELRSPISSIRFDLEVALAHPESDDWHSVATRALDQTLRVEHIVDDLLLLARIDEGTAPDTAAIVDIGSIIRDSSTHIEGTPISLRVDIGDVNALYVNGTTGDLTSMIRNLVDNAARHAASSIAVTANVDGSTIVITVDDDGPGIPPADRERVFRRFTRLQQSRSRSAGGVGLGLAVVHRIVHHHGGTIAISDSPLGGARFTVALPAASPKVGSARAS
jgi:signal transduction histidine kinase